MRTSPYSTGGGGTVLEHRYCALILSHLLTGDPIPELGDDATITGITFQAGTESAVDDLLIEGHGADGEVRHVSVAVRRTARLIPSDRRSVELTVSFLSVMKDRSDDLASGRWRLALASTSGSSVRQVGDLAAIAHTTPDPAAFRQAVGQPGRTTQPVRNRLESIGQVLQRAAQQVDIGDVPLTVLAWRLLRSLTVRELRLELPEESDRTAAVARLRQVTKEQTAAEADRLFTALERLASGYAPQGAEIDISTLRRDLRGSADLRRSERHPEAWGVLDRLSERLQARTRPHLDSPTRPPLEFDRAEAVEALIGALQHAGATSPDVSPALMIVGEPDVGKSALTLRSAEKIQSSGGAVVCLSLRDLPETTVETERVLGASIGAVLAGAEVSSLRLLVVDGAEAVLEGRRELFTDFVAAALAAGLGVAAVTRSDGERSVGDAMRNAFDSSFGTDPEPARHTVEGLTVAEVDEMVAAFPTLNRVAQDSRSAWLLRRPGLADVLLRADSAVAFTERPLSEADVFAAVWSSLVRREEKSTAEDGVTPDERENALIALIRRNLALTSPMDTPSDRALPSLRSDGLLLSASPTIAWRQGDDFASDLIRDFVLARLLRIKGCAPLQSAGAPRWAIRSARLACQAALADAGKGIEQVRAELQAQFDQLADEHGDRWAELPLEATLLLGNALVRAWPALQADGQQELATLLRIARQRYVRDGIGEPAVLGPLVEMICDHWHELRESLGYTLSSEVYEIILEWLRGLIWHQAGPDSLRARIRDQLLADRDNTHREFQVETLALLGPDFDSRAEQQLRDVAVAAPGRLAPCVEQPLAVHALAQRSPDLLAELAEAYYIERPANDGPPGMHYDVLDAGVRDHHRLGSSRGRRMAAWHYGPFWNLLVAHPRLGLRTINRILNHAARARAGLLRETSESSLGLSDDVVEYELDLPGCGHRSCIGDSHVWRWYRGSSVGPRPCTSALLAVERCADAWIAQGANLDGLVKLLLEDCHNVAMPGLVVGLLVRHPGIVTDDLDIWLAQPGVWSLEIRRLVSEGHLHIQGPDDDDVAGRDFRSTTLTQVAAFQVERAVREENDERISALRACGRDLMRRARSTVSGSGSRRQHTRPRDRRADDRCQWLVTVFDRDNFRYVALPDGQIAVKIELPPTLRTAREDMDAQTVQFSKYMHLLNTYACVEDRRSASETMRDDLSLARSLVEDPPEGVDDYREGPAAVAASAVLAHADATVALSEDELDWSANLLMSCAFSPRRSSFDVEDSWYLTGADRSAAARVTCAPRSRRKKRTRGPAA